MIRPIGAVIMYRCQCDKCGDIYSGYDGNEEFGLAELEAMMNDDGWRTDGDKHICPKCLKAEVPESKGCPMKCNDCTFLLDGFCSKGHDISGDEKSCDPCDDYEPLPF